MQQNKVFIVAFSACIVFSGYFVDSSFAEQEILEGQNSQAIESAIYQSQENFFNNDMYFESKKLVITDCKNPNTATMCSAQIAIGYNFSQVLLTHCKILQANESAMSINREYTPFTQNKSALTTQDCLYLLGNDADIEAYNQSKSVYNKLIQDEEDTIQRNEPNLSNVTQVDLKTIEQSCANFKREQKNICIFDYIVDEFSQNLTTTVLRYY